MFIPQILKAETRQSHRGSQKFFESGAFQSAIPRGAISDRLCTPYAHPYDWPSALILDALERFAAQAQGQFQCPPVSSCKTAQTDCRHWLVRVRYPGWL